MAWQVGSIVSAIHKPLTNSVLYMLFIGSGNSSTSLFYYAHTYSCVSSTLIHSRTRRHAHTHAHTHNRHTAYKTCNRNVYTQFYAATQFILPFQMRDCIGLYVFHFILLQCFALLCIALFCLAMWYTHTRTHILSHCAPCLICI